MNKVTKLILSILLPQLVGGLGALVTISSEGSWYSSLQKPFFNPPPWLFGPVWTILYLMMGYALYLLWTSEHPSKKSVLRLFFLQLLLNGLWSPAFFGLESTLLGLVTIIPLWITILMCIKAFRPVQPTAAYLMIPYFLWVSFATLLTASIWYLNPEMAWIVLPK